MARVIKLRVVDKDGKVYNPTLRDDREALHYFIGMLSVLYPETEIDVTRVEEENPDYALKKGD